LIARAFGASGKGAQWVQGAGLVGLCRKGANTRMNPRFALSYQRRQVPPKKISLSRPH
jgi:hypothetical protein